MLRDIIRRRHRGSQANTTHLAHLATLALANSDSDALRCKPIHESCTPIDEQITNANLANLTNSTHPTISQEPKTVTADDLELFERLYAQLKGHYGWVNEDYETWLSDLWRDSEQTLNCLEAMVSSWADQRYGVLEPKDWGQPARLFRGLTLKQSRIVSAIIRARLSYDDRKLCVECKHLLAAGDSWRCGNWVNAKLAYEESGAGLSWHLITQPQRCDGFVSEIRTNCEPASGEDPL